MRSQVHLEVRELPEGLEANIALVMHLAVLLLQRVGERAVAAAVWRALLGQRRRQGPAGM